MKLPTDDSRPPYLLAADVLRQEITSGRIKPGDRLPSARELEERFGIANMTVRSALRVLREEGLIYSVQGRGSYVRNAPEKAGGEIDTAAGPESANAATAEPGAEWSEVMDLLNTTLQQVKSLSDRVAEVESELTRIRRQEPR
ncbi:GntR family transcriptional regulator [Wenjunlia tyrosinilytica]|uniref:HTH gntR-type domain-containing protein n=1 Tax=Wenjunlia tyrosinilytica TaxID=1544741 RepID=A0A918DXF7_9ACTN|nr:winged helix-turn-helix domain-containing protein [Wenjunlia tyrosinilytica]GGO86501.1 hypothetical protein GCM10012280_22780 [Wenjunlia tyrosinilytica]